MIGSHLIRRSMAPALAGLIAALGVQAVANEAGAAQDRQWIAHIDHDSASLIYGTPQSDDVLLTFTCESAAKTLTVWFRIDPVYSKNPATMPMEIFSEAGRVELTGKGSRSEMDDGYALQAATTLTPEFEKLLTEGRTISIMVEDGVEELPIDAAARRAIEGIVKACRN